MKENGRRSVFQPGRLAGLELKNRVIRAGCFEGMCQGGQVTEALTEHHRRVAAGGVYCVSNESGFMHTA